MATALKVKSKKEGFRRAGFSFGSEEKIIPLTELSKGQIEALKGESNLLVSEVEIDDEKKPDGGKKAGGGKA